MKRPLGDSTCNVASARSIARRRFLQMTAAGAGAALLSMPRARTAADVAPGAGAQPVLRFPEKADLILQTDRPPNLEMPLEYLRHDLTPNEAFYVRWHLAVLPTVIDTAAFRLNLG